VLVVLNVGLLLYAGFITPSAAAEFNEKPGMVSGKTTLVIGKVSANPKKHYRQLKAMADYAVKHMKDLGIVQAKVLMAKDNRQMIHYLKQGKVDWVTETLFSAFIFQDETDAEILLKRWKKDVPDYYTVFFARKDSGIDSLPDLKGKTIAFEDPGSTTAYFEAASALMTAGLKLTWVESQEEKPPSDRVGYLFSRQEINTSVWVYQGLVDAGAFSNLDWNKDDHLPKAFKKDLKIFYRNDPIPRAFELTRKDLDPRLKLRLKEVLLNAHMDPKARSALRAYQKTKKFEDWKETDWPDRDEIKHIINKVQSELE